MRRIHIQPRERGGKTYYTALYYLPDGSGRSTGTFTSKAKAKSAAEVAWEKSRQSNWVDPASGKRSLTAYAEGVWFLSVVVEVATLRDYDSLWRNHVKPAFGDRAIAEILPTQVSTWINQMEADGVGRATQRKAFGVLNMILKCAFGDRIVPSIATLGVKTKPLNKPPVRIFSHKQWEAFIAAVPEQDRLLLEVAVATGLRASELRALTPSQVLWSQEKILVDRALVEVGKKFGGGQRFAPKAYPKGKRSRLVSVDRPLLRRLAQEIMRRGLPKDGVEPIFTVNGKTMGNDITRDIFKAAREKAEIDAQLTMKHLRSSRASWLLKETGGDVALVMRELGHADIQTTQKYLAVVEEAESDNESAFEDFLKEEES